jgi:hypothetical protein
MMLRPKGATRMLSSNAGGEQQQEGEKKTNDDEMSNEIVLTPGEKVAAYSRLSMYFMAALFAGGCAYFIGKELIPTYVPCIEYILCRRISFANNQNECYYLLFTRPYRMLYPFILPYFVICI